MHSSCEINGRSPKEKLGRQLDIHAYSALFPPLDAEAFKGLAQDIQAHGLNEPILLYRGRVLDGRSRYQACLTAGIKPHFVEFHGTEEEALCRVISANLHRRHLTKSQAAALAVEVLPLFEEAAEKRRLAAIQAKKGCRVKVHNTSNGRSDVQAGRLYGVSGRYVAEAKKIRNEAPELFQRLKTGSMNLKGAKRELRVQKARERRDMPTNPHLSPAPNIRLVHSDFRKVEIEAASVHLILTDPPYAKECLPLWSDLARMAQRVLVPGGFLVCLSGTYFLPQIYSALSLHMDYFWTGCLRLTGAQGHRLDRGLVSQWRPLLIFQKPPTRKPANLFFDMLDSGGSDTTHHEWGQKVGVYERLLHFFSRDGDLIFDPFCGGGSIVEACRNLRRDCIACDIDPDAVNVARNRLAVQNG